MLHTVPARSGLWESRTLSLSVATRYEAFRERFREFAACTPRQPILRNMGTAARCLELLERRAPVAEGLADELGLVVAAALLLPVGCGARFANVIEAAGRAAGGGGLGGQRPARSGPRDG